MRSTMRLAALFCIIAFWSFNLVASERHLLGNPTEESPSSSDTSTDVSLRITGGNEAAATEFPWQVALVDDQDDSILCGGAIIGERHILTAAHCVHFESFTDFAKVATGRNIHARYVNRGYDTKSVTIHPGYLYKSLNECDYEIRNDIAVITLAEKIKLSDYEQIVDLPTQNLTSGIDGIFTAYGADRVLKKLQIYIIDYDHCKRIHPVDIAPGKICSVNDNLNQRSSPSDGGGPLVYNNTLVGIISKRYSCPGFRLSADYSDVHFYDEFIRNTMAST